MHKCLTYFLIYSKRMIDMKIIVEALGLSEDVISKMTEQSLEIGRCDKYDVNINNMIRTTIKSLVGKKDILLALKEKYNLEFYLSKVVMLDVKSNIPNPILSLEGDVIEFLYKTNTIDDIDYYL